MASVQPGARDRVRERKRTLLAHSRGQIAPPKMKEPATWAAVAAETQRVGDVRALDATPIPSMDFMCPPGGRMYSQAGVLFCRYD